MFDFYLRLLNLTWLTPLLNLMSLLNPVYGNYHSYAFFVKEVKKNHIQPYYSYYSKRPFTLDPRLRALPKGLFRGATVLDIGCNEGWVTCEIGNLSPFSIVPASKLITRK